MPLIESQKSELEKEINRIIRDADLEEERALWQKNKVKKKSFLRSATDLFFEPKSWERWQGGRMYELLGINVFRKYLLGPWMKFTRRRKPNNGKPDTYFIGNKKSLEDIKSYVDKAKYNEVVHTLGGLIMLPWFFEDFNKRVSEGDYFGAIATCVIPFAFNAYLSLNQRYIRARCYNIIEHREAKKNANKS